MLMNVIILQSERPKVDHHITRGGAVSQQNSSSLKRKRLSNAKSGPSPEPVLSL